MGRPERRLDPDAGPLQRFAVDLRRLRAEAGGPSYRELSRRAHYSVTALSEAAGGEVLPSLPVTLAYVRACGADVEPWRERWHGLAAELVDGERVRGGQPAVEAVVEAPYLGLATFEPADAGRFFGRRRLVDELCSRLTQSRFLAVFGASGAGKSSLLRAGLLPAVCNGEVRDGRDWPTVLFTPGERPVQELAVHLANLGGIAASPVHRALTEDPDGVRLTLRQLLAQRSATARLLVVVDQFEEVFTLCQDGVERAVFIDLLLAMADEERGARVVLGVRADFYARCTEHSALTAALHDHQVLVGPMNEDELRSVVIEPAQAMGLRVQPALVEAVVADARGQPGSLPLVAHALLETWRRRSGTTLTLAGYRAVGGVQGAIAQTADRVYGELGADERRLAREIFLRLTVLGEGTEDTRRRAPRAELLFGPDGARCAAVLDRLTAARLVSADEDTVTIAHEALIRGWPALRGWLAEDREILRAHRRLTEAATEWHQLGRDEGLLYQGARLARWDGSSQERLNDLERAFLAAGRRREQRERTAGQRRARRILAVLGTGAALVSILAAVALVQADRAASERDLALSRQLAAQARSELQLDPELGLLLAQHAFDQRPTAEAEAVLRQALADFRVRAVVPGHRGRGLGVTVSPDGTRLASSSSDGVVRLWEWSKDGRVLPAAPMELRGLSGEAWTPVFSPNGRRIAAAGLDGTVRVWDLDGSSGDSAVPSPTALVLRGHRGPVWSVAFSPDGRRLASSGDDGTVRVWDAAGTGRALVVRPPGIPAPSVAFSPDGRQVASSGHDGKVRIQNTDGTGTPLVLTGPRATTKTVAFTPDGTHVASASVDGTAWVWSTTGRGAPVVLRGHRGTVEGLTFSPDGRWLATTSDDAIIRVWDWAGSGEPLLLRGHRATAWSVAFSPDGHWLASASDDGTVRIWDPRSSGDLVEQRAHPGGAWSVAFLPDGRRVASGGHDGTVRIWDATGHQPSPVLRGPTDEVLGVGVSPDGRRVAGASRDGTVWIWNTTGAGRPVVLHGHRGIVWNAAFSPDARRVATAGFDGTLRIWDLSGRTTPLVRRADQTQIRYVAYSPDGKHVATAGWDGTVRIWDTSGATPPVIRRGHNRLVWAVAFSPDGRRLASAGSDGTVRIWPVTGTGEPIIQRGHLGSAWHLAFSRDGRWVASAGKDGTVRVFPTTAQSEGIVFGGFGTTVESVDFSPDGQRLLTAHGDGTLRVWTCDACAPINRVLALASQRVSRSLTAEEYQTFIKPNE